MIARMKRAWARLMEFIDEAAEAQRCPTCGAPMVTDDLNRWPL